MHPRETKFSIFCPQEMASILCKVSLIFSQVFSQGAFCFKKVVDDPPLGFLDNIIPPIFLANLIFSKALD
jgi:hypothetical protein